MSPGITHITFHAQKEKVTGYNLKAGNIKEFVVMI